MTPYKEAKERTFASGTVPNGYFGETINVWFAFDPESQRILTGTDSGYHSLIEPGQVMDEAEAYWRLQHNRIVTNLKRIKELRP